MTEIATQPAARVARTRLTARAFIVGERIDTAGLERSDVINIVPLAFRVGDGPAAAVVLEVPLAAGPVPAQPG